jgi:ABC-type dipeptide/oligopeptide/nickel transport system permease subunit
MSAVIIPEADITEMPPRVNEFRRFLRVFLTRKVVVIGMVIIVSFILVAIFAPLIAPYDPYEPDLTIKLNQPSSAHLLGTDNLGRDTISRIIY